MAWMPKLILSKQAPALRRMARRAGDDYGVSDTPDWRDVDWRAHLRQEQIAGRTVNYVDIGEGPEQPIVFIHGLSGVWQNWLENIMPFTRDRRVVAMDLPGFGHSEIPAEKISISGFAKAVEDLCERLELGNVAVVGNSMGGFAGAEMAIAFPRRVERLVLISAAGISIRDLRREPLMAVAKGLAFLGTATAAQERAVLRRPAFRHALFSFVFRHPTRLSPDLLWEQMQGTGKPGFVDALDALTSYDFVDRLPEIACPTLIVWGRNDMLVPVSDADEFERLIPDSRKVVLDETGHCAMLERPRTFNECLAKFLAEEPETAQPEPAVAQG